ncbi:MAG: WYL domain-containing protein [Candidatus Marinimicrobia bacterium]|nr:WYL domain-containing protein [Candidatus Neomarinimicrobiota bacterium]MCH7763704.1 WYL domain-containing protein [Candidatus Neomarinimicrobiota bacterium]
MKVKITPELISWILSWHKYVKVLKPQELVDEIKRSVEEIKQLYID